MCRDARLSHGVRAPLVSGMRKERDGDILAIRRRIRVANSGEHGIARAEAIMHAHDGVVTQRTNEAGSLAVVRAEVFVSLDATCERHASTQRGEIQIASEVDPLATTARPCLAAKGLGDAGREERQLKLGEMFADHGECDSDNTCAVNCNARLH